LIALEECRFEELPEGIVYQKNFIKRYLRAIGVDPKPFVAQFLMEECESAPTVRQHPAKKINGSRFHNIPMVVRYGVTSLVVLGFLGYIAFQVANILEPPQLVIQTPQNGLVTEEASIRIQGQTNPEVRVTVNGKEIMNNDRGEFEETIDLSPGVNELFVSAQKKHGKTTAETRYVILKQLPAGRGSQEISRP
jgi:cytoskeletal protein RodZ